MPRMSLLGGSYQDASLIAAAQRCVNIFPEKIPEDTQERANVVHLMRPGLRFLSGPAAPHVGIPNILALDGVPVIAGNGVFGPGGTVFPMPSGFTNAKPNSIIIAAFASEGSNNGVAPQPTVSGVSDNSGQGLTWRKLVSVGWIDNGPGVTNAPFNLAVWWAIAPAALNNVTVTFTTSGNIVDDATAIVFAVSGVNTVAPWDDNISLLPATKTALNGISPTPSIGGLSSNASSGMLLVFGAGTRNTNHAGWDVAGGGFTEISHSVNFQDVLDVAMGVEFANFSAALQGVSATFNNSAFTPYQGSAYAMIAAALVPGFS